MSVIKFYTHATPLICLCDSLGLFFQFIFLAL